MVKVNISQGSLLDGNTFANEVDQVFQIAVSTDGTQLGIIGGLDIEVEGVAEGTAIVVGPFQVLRELGDGSAIRAVTGTRAP